MITIANFRRNHQPDCNFWEALLKTSRLITKYKKSGFDMKTLYRLLSAKSKTNWRNIALLLIPRPCFSLLGGLSSTYVYWFSFSLIHTLFYLVPAEFFSTMWSSYRVVKANQNVERLFGVTIWRRKWTKRYWNQTETTPSGQPMSGEAQLAR